MLVFAAAAVAAPFELLTGVDAQRYPGTARSVAPSPGPGFPGTFYDGDRLAGTSDTGPMVTFQGVGTPLFPTNHVGATSFLFRRGSVPVGGPNVVPLMGIEFLGGPLLDLDGDLTNGQRRLTPVVGATPVTIPDSFSYIDLDVDQSAGLVTIRNIDATGTNEAGPGIQAEVAVTLTTIAGTTATGGMTGPINPAYDTRSGGLTPFTGTGGTLAGVYHINQLSFEFWNDSIDPNSSSAGVLGTFQHFVRARGWLVYRDCHTGQFPTLAGQGLGSTLWPAVDVSQVGMVFNTAHGLAGGTATIKIGVPQDNYSLVPPNGGVAMGSFAGDLGAYLDAVVRPLVAPECDAYVYLEAAGFGINNSGDPVFTDTIAYDLVLIGQQRRLPADLDDDGDVDLDDRDLFVQALTNPAAADELVLRRADLNADCHVDGDDIPAFVPILAE